MRRSKLLLITLMAVLVGALFVAACSDSSSPTAPLPPTESATAAPGTASLMAGQPEADLDPGVTGQEMSVEMALKGGGCSGKKVAICHLPPGNPDNIQEICISTNAVPAHKAHGDYEPLTFWPDADGDGFGDAAAMGESGCTVPVGYVENQDDCNDYDAAINSDADDSACDGVDDNCDGTADDGYISSPTTCGEGVCANNTGFLECQSGEEVDTCDPLAGASGEVCDDLDNDCDGAIDEDNVCPSGPPTTCFEVEFDADGFADFDYCCTSDDNTGFGSVPGCSAGANNPLHVGTRLNIIGCVTLSRIARPLGRSMLFDPPGSPPCSCNAGNVFFLYPGEPCPVSP